MQHLTSSYRGTKDRRSLFCMNSAAPTGRGLWSRIPSVMRTLRQPATYLTFAKAFRNCMRGTFVETSFMPLAGVRTSRLGGHVVVTCYHKIRFAWVVCSEVADRFKRWFARSMFCSLSHSRPKSWKGIQPKKRFRSCTFSHANGTSEFLGLMLPFAHALAAAERTSH